MRSDARPNLGTCNFPALPEHEGPSRSNLIRAICQAVREQVGPDYPLLIKLGMADVVDGGLTLEEGAQVVAALEGMGLDGVEISAGIGGRRRSSTRVVRSEADEAYFRPWARKARPVTRLPILLVGGFRTHRIMEEVLASGNADFVSLCRPLICEPDLPNRMRLGLQERSSCISGDRCWPEEAGAGISCKSNHLCLQTQKQRRTGNSYGSFHR